MTGHDTAKELIGILEAELSGSARNIQTKIGPSGLGTTCTRCLVHGLIETERIDKHIRPSWWAGVGTAVHMWAEITVAHYELNRIRDGHPPRWSTELPVTIGAIPHPIHTDQEITLTGTCDLYDETNGVVLDYKVLGKTSLGKFISGRPPTIYRRQVQLYGLGIALTGKPVREVVILGIPRDAPDLGMAVPIVYPFDADDALATFDRARRWAQTVRDLGIDAAFDEAGPHTGTEYSCHRFADAHVSVKPSKPSTVSSFLGLI